MKKISLVLLFVTLSACGDSETSGNNKTTAPNNGMTANNGMSANNGMTVNNGMTANNGMSANNGMTSDTTQTTPCECPLPAKTECVGTQLSTTTCNFTCENDTTLLECSKVVAPICDGNIAVTYTDMGVCDPAGCVDPTEVRVDCALTNQGCEMGACIDIVPVAPGAGDLVITEIFADATSSDTGKEWFEIYNPTNAPIILNGLILKESGSDTHTIAGATDILVQPGQYFVLGESADMASNGGVTVDYEFPPSYDLKNTTDQIIIEGANAIIIDEVEWKRDAITITSGVSAQVGKQHDLNAIDNTDAQFWCNATTAFGDGDFGTPGAENSECLPPQLVTIYDVQDVTAVNHPVENSTVEIKNVVVSGKNGSFIWIQEENGGPYSGIFLRPNAVANAVSTLLEGVKFDLVGVYSESRGNSQITLKSFTLVGNGIIDPVVLESSIFVDPIEAEKWEGVLVQINEAGVTRKNPDAPNNNFGEFLIDSKLRVDDLLFGFMQPEPCTFYEKIVGPMNYSFGKFKILPRSAADLVVSAIPVSMQRGAPAPTIDINVGSYSPAVTCIRENAAIVLTNKDPNQTQNAVSRNPAASAPNNFLTPSTVMATGAPLLLFNSSILLSFTGKGTHHYRSTPVPAMEGVIIVAE